MKEFEQDSTGGTCPECGKHNMDTEGSSVSGDDGSYFTCTYCNAVSILIHEGARFNYKGTVFEVRSSTPECYTVDMFPCIEVSRKNASPLWKPSPSGYRYFGREQIVKSMVEGYREDM